MDKEDLYRQTLLDIKKMCEHWTKVDMFTKMLQPFIDKIDLVLNDE